MALSAAECPANKPINLRHKLFSDPQKWFWLSKHPGETEGYGLLPRRNDDPAVAELEKNGFRSAVISAVRQLSTNPIAMSKPKN